MPKTTTIDHTSVLEMVLGGFELQRNRIEAAIAIRVRIGSAADRRGEDSRADRAHVICGVRVIVGAVNPRVVRESKLRSRVE